MLDTVICDRARIARDARFDGRFFTGVRTTRIYCRPICPVTPAKSAHVCFFPSAAAAERAGFRPCLRCRPEAAPGTPAWHGSATTASRGLALINAGFLDDHSVAELAVVLGIGTRHLTRLFMKYLGASPRDLGRTRRVQIAKKLLDETSLPITEIALVSGFSSIRRFNAVFKETYGRSPSSFRRHGSDRRGDTHIVSLELSYRPPFHWPLLTTLLAHEATPGVEAICDGAYHRTITVGSAAGYFCVRPVPNRHALLLSLHLPEYAHLKSIIERLRLLFDLEANPTPILHHLEQHPQIASLVRNAKGLRLPGTWNGFEVAVRVLVARDLGASHTPAIMGKLAATYGLSLPASGNCRLTTLFPTPATLMQASLTDLGLSPRAAHQVTRLACAVAHEHLRFDPTMAFHDLVNGLIEVAELDSPSAHWVAMRTLGEPDASPFGAPSVPEVYPCSDTTLQETWRPWRSYIAVLLALRSTDRMGVAVQCEI